MIDHLPPFDPQQLARVESIIDSWVSDEVRAHEMVVDAHRDPLEPRWWIKAQGEERSDIAVWFWLRQRTVEVESAFMPAPIDNKAELFEMLLRRNASQVGLAFDMSAEGGIFLRGHLANDAITYESLDGALGAVYAYTEATFRPAIRLGFASVIDG